MKFLQICIFAACCVLLTGTAAGYSIAFTVSPEETVAGVTITVTGTSTIPAGYTDEALLYREVPNYPSRDAGRYPFTIAEGGNWEFTIDTTGFVPATYKIQLPKSEEYPYGSSAVLMRTFIITAPQETPVPATLTPSATSPALTPTATTSAEEAATLPVPPEPTTSSAGMVTALAAAGTSALAFAFWLGKRNE